MLQVFCVYELLLNHVTFNGHFWNNNEVWLLLCSEHWVFRVRGQTPFLDVVFGTFVRSWFPWFASGFFSPYVAAYVFKNKHKTDLLGLFVILRVSVIGVIKFFKMKAYAGLKSIFYFC